MKVWMLEKALPQHEMLWLQQLLQEGQKVTSQGFLAQLKTKMARIRENEIRQKWGH